MILQNAKSLRSPDSPRFQMLLASGGHWSSKSRVDVLNDTIVAAEKMKRILSRKHRRIIEGSIITWYLEMVKLFTCEEDYNRGSAYAKKCLKRLVAHRPVPNSTLLGLVLIGYFPILYRFLANKPQSNRYRRVE
jgi:hypothetical protein